MNWYKIYKNASSKRQKSYGWISVKVPKDIRSKLSSYSKKIPDRELYLEEKENKEWKYGRETDFHITLLYGIHTKNEKKIRKILEETTGGNVNLSKIDCFKNENYDVLKVNIISSKLRSLNELLRENIKYTSDFDQYSPHITIAYLKCGNGEKYKKDNTFKNMSFYFNEVIFEDSEDNKYNIMLKDI